ncbi:MAG: hypothetical protein QOE73_368 [Verrucomicrobiota bacterium]
MCENLRLKSGDSGEFPDHDRVRAVNQVPMGNGRVFANDQLRLSIFLVGEMARRPERKTGNPVTVSYGSVCFQVKQIDILTNSEVSDAAAFFHDQARGKDEGNPNSAGRMNLESELLLEKIPPHAPRKQKADEHQDFFHDLISS